MRKGSFMVTFGLALTLLSACGANSGADDELVDCVIEKTGVHVEAASDYHGGSALDAPQECFRLEVGALGLVSRFLPSDDCRPGYADCINYAYDSAGKLSARYSDQSCKNAAAKDELCTSYTYDAQGRLASEAEASDCDGVADSCTEFGYDAQGRVNAKSSGNCKGEKDYCEHYTYDAFGNLLEAKDDGEGCTGGGASCCRYTYDAKGNTVSGGCGKSCSGDFTEGCLALTYDAQGRLSLSVYEETCSETRRYCVAYHYDAQGRVSAKEGGCDSEKSDCETFTYDAAGRVATHVTDDKCDGTDLISLSFSYDSAGRRIERRIKTLPGSPENIYTYTWGRCSKSAVEGLTADLENYLDEESDSVIGSISVR